MAMSRSEAETVGLQAIAWLAGNDDLLPVFMSSTGADETALREGLSDPSFQAAVLDFLLMDDVWIVDACDALSVPYETPQAARAALPGGERMHWT